jgi:hypothetical protein
MAEGYGHNLSSIVQDILQGHLPLFEDGQTLGVGRTLVKRGVLVLAASSLFPKIIVGNIPCLGAPYGNSRIVKYLDMPLGLVSEAVHCRIRSQFWVLGTEQGFSWICLLMCIIATSLTGNISDTKYRSRPVGNKKIICLGWGCHATGRPRPG